MARAGRVEIEFAANLARLQQDVGRATGMLEGFARTARAALGTLGVGLSIAGLSSIVKNAAEATFELNKMAQSIGMTAQELSKYDYIAKMAGLDSSEFAKGIRMMDRNMFTAAQSTGKAFEAFRTLGISVKDATGHLRPNSDILGELAERFSKMPDGTMKTALAMQVFGRAGADMIPVLNMGRDGLKAWSDEAERVKGALSDETIQRATAFHQIMVKMSAWSEAGKKQLFAGMADDLIRISDAWSLVIEKGTIWQSLGKAIGFVLKILAAAFLGWAETVEFSITAILGLIDVFKTKWDQMADVVNNSGIKKAFEEAFGIKLNLPQFNEARVGLDVVAERLNNVRKTYREARKELDILYDRKVTLPAIPKGGAGEIPAVPPSKQQADAWAKIQAEMAADLQKHSLGLDEHDRAIIEVNKRYDEFKVKASEHSKAIDENRFKVIGLIRAEQDLANSLKATALAIQAERDEFERRQQVLALNRYQLTGSEQAAAEAANLQHLVDGFRSLREQQDLFNEKGRQMADQLTQQIDANERLIDVIKMKNRVETDGLEGTIAALAKYRTEVENLGVQMGDMVVSNIRRMEDAFIEFVQTGKLSFSDLIRSIEADLLRLVVRQAITGPLSTALSQALGGAGGAGSMPWDSFFNFGPSFAFHAGGTVGRGGVPRSVPAGLFFQAPRLHGGLAADEVPAILQKGETVIPKGQGARPVSVTMNVYTQDANSFRASEGQILRRMGSGMRRASR